MGIRESIKNSLLADRNQKKNGSEDLLPPPVRRLVFGEENEEEELKAVLGDLYDQLENLEDAHDETYAEVEISISGKNIEVRVKKDRGADRSTRSRKFKEETITFTLSELVNQDRKYLVDRVEQDIDTQRAAPTHEVERAEGIDASVTTPEELSDEEKKEIDASDSGMTSPLEDSLKSDEDESSSSMKESILNHTD